MWEKLEQKQISIETINILKIMYETLHYILDDEHWYH